MTTLQFFKEIKNNNIEKNNFAENMSRSLEQEFDLKPNETDVVNDSKVEEVLSNIDSTVKYLKNEIQNQGIDYENYFDNDIKKHLDIMHKHISNYIPNYPKYYDGNKIYGKAYLDARDIIKHEFPITPEQIKESEDTISGIINDTKLNFDNGFSVDSVGNVYDPTGKIIFKPSEAHQKVSFIDLLNKKVVTDNGIRIDLPDDFIKKNVIDNEKVSQNFKDRLIELEKIIGGNKNETENDSVESGGNNNGGSNSIHIDSSKVIVGKVDGTYIAEKDRIFIEMPLEDTYLGDIFGDEFTVDFIGQIKKYKIETNSFSTCNFKEIPYAEMQSLLFWGGGERGVKPLSSSEISDKDINFKPDGTVYYTGANSVIRTKRKGCPSKTYKTGHLMMYSSDNKVGLKRSIIQHIYGFCSSIGIFNANIPKLIGFKKFKVFPGLCIGGLLELVLCSWQERISTRINELFQCIPSSMPSDNSFSGFENETYPQGATVKTVKELDDIKSCKFGDKFVVDVVDPSISGLTTYACGQFVFDPNNRLSQTHKWRYKDFSGKPYNIEDVKVIKEFSTMYENPLVKDILMNSNALGQDSITRKMMSLQFAYLKKQSLLTLGEVEASMDATVEAVIYDALDKLTFEISRYEYMRELHLIRTSKVPNFESDQYCNEFFEHFRLCVDSGSLKMPNLEKHRRTYKLMTSSGSGSGNGNGAGSVAYEYIDYYDFNSLNPDEYLVPKREHVSKYDSMMFSDRFCPNQQLNDIYESNIRYLESIGQDIGKYKNIKTMNDFINVSDIKDSINRDITDNLSYIRADLEYDEYEPTAFQQVEKRCYHLVNNKKIFNAS